MKTQYIFNEIKLNNWNYRTKDLLIALKGSGNMFGSSHKLIHVTLHGDNSITKTGVLTINGVATSNINISRGANGETSETIMYYKGLTDFDNLYNTKESFKIAITGSGGGGESALSTMLSAEKTYLKD